MLLRERQRDGVGVGSGAKDKQSDNYTEKKNARGKRNASLERVELMDNVSPLWCWQAGRMHL